jgi:hypothetical protein
VSCDTRGYAAWLANLYSDKRKAGEFRLPPPPVYVLHELNVKLQQQRQVQSRQKKTYEVGIISEKLRAVNAMLKAMDTAAPAGEIPQVAG